MTKKHCPYCSHSTDTLTLNDVGTYQYCDKCGKRLYISRTLRDNPRCGHAGGFRLIKDPEPPSVSPEKLLEHLTKAQPTYAAKIAKKIGKPATSVRACLTKLEAEGKINCTKRGNYKYYKVVA